MAVLEVEKEMVLLKSLRHIFHIKQPLFQLIIVLILWRFHKQMQEVVIPKQVL